MKKIYFLITVMIFLIMSSCKKDEQMSDNLFKYQVSVTKNGVIEPTASVMFIYSETEERIVSCNHNGLAILESAKPVKLIVAMSLGYSNSKELILTDKSEIKINLEDVLKNDDNKTLKSAQYLGTFGVYSTDGNGDVKFRYQGTFANYYCTSYLPWLLTTNDPNGWDGWSLNDFLPWNGKMLLVPRRYQDYHSITYGFSISQALFLNANI